MSNTTLQQEPKSTGVVADWRSERLVQALRRCGAWFARVPASVWRFLVKLALVIWLAYTLAQVVWLLVPAPETPQARVAPNALEADRGDATGERVDIAQLASLEIFGRVAEGGEPEEFAGSGDAPGGSGIEDEAVDTELKLVLRGIMGSNEEAAARAIIADGSDQAIYAPGDELPVRGSVTLEKVLPLRVILNNSGRYESLWLYSDNDLGSSLAASRPVPDTPSRSWEGDDSEDMAESPEPQDDMRAEEDTEEPVEEQELEEAADEVADRMGSQSLSDVVSMSIHREDGQIVGYKIRPGRNQAMFDSLGLEAGDVVKAVNGVELSSPQRVMEIYRDMGDASSASLLIERGGQELSVDIELE